MSRKGLDYATSLVRRVEGDAVYLSYFYPASLRPFYIGLKALNIELASIQDQVSNPMVGLMRFQWWRDNMKQLREGKRPEHPLLQLLGSVPFVRDLAPYHFTRLINTRERHMLDPSFENLTSLADYSAGTQASVLYLLLQATALSEGAASGVHAKLFEHMGREHLGEADAEGHAGSGLAPPTDLDIDHAASHLSVFITIAILLRSIPFHSHKRINIIPRAITTRHNLSEEDLFRNGPNAEGLPECVATMVGIANAELKTARDVFRNTSGLPHSYMPAFLSATPHRSFIDQLSSSKVSFDIFNPGLHRRYWKVPFQIMSDYRKKAF